MNPPTADNNFEKFRRDRRQRRAQFGTNTANVPRPHGARDADAYEAKQVHETRLTRDVHDFLAEATKQAATIVEKVTLVAEAESAQRLAREMQEFLQETMRRAATFMHMVQATRGKAAVQDLEPHLSNLVGPSLDGFRHEGTAQLTDKHIGQDPFDENQDHEDAHDEAPDEAHDEAHDGQPVRDALPATATTQEQQEQAAMHAADRRADTADHLMACVARDSATLKRALKALVQAQVLTQDDARNIYRGALQGSAA